MSAYIKLSTLEYPRHVGDIQLDFAGETDYAFVEWVSKPIFEPETQRCVEGAPVQVDGKWRMTWVVRDATAQEIEYANRPISLRGTQ
jgi:hypothetical protein